MKKSASVNVVSAKVMSATEAAYMAGMVDGEGSVTLIKAAWKRNRAGFQFQPLLTIANTFRPVLERLVEMCGNGRIVATYNTKHAAHKVGYRVVFTSNQIRHVLPQLVPYLVIKKRQAELLIEYLGEWRKGLHITDESYRRGEDFRQQLRALNQRGNDPTVAEAEWAAIRPSRLGNNQHRKALA
jgi:hypothetical protein